MAHIRGNPESGSGTNTGDLWKRKGREQRVEQGSLLPSKPERKFNGNLLGEDANQWECLQVWHSCEGMGASWGDERHAWERCHFGEACFRDACFQQPYVGSEEHFDTPFTTHDQGSHSIEIGVDRQISQVFESAGSVRWDEMDTAVEPWDQLGSTSVTPEEGSSSAQAPCSSMSEQLVETASYGTCVTGAQEEGPDLRPSGPEKNDRTDLRRCADVSGASDPKKLEDSRHMAAWAPQILNEGQKADEGTKRALCSSCSERRHAWSSEGSFGGPAGEGNGSHPGSACRM